MRNPFQGESFNQLKAHWYRKLRESGFQDIESEDNPSGSMVIKDWHSQRFQKPDKRSRTNPISMEATSRYYDLAVHLLESFEFETHLQRRIWAFHAHGFSLREIGRLVGKDKDHVHGVVRNLKARMIG